MTEQGILSTLCRQERIADGIQALNAILSRPKNLRRLKFIYISSASRKRRNKSLVIRSAIWSASLDINCGRGALSLISAPVPASATKQILA